MPQTVYIPNSKITQTAQTSGSVATFLANIAAIDILSFTISDSSINIAGNLNALQAASTKIASIILSDTLSPLAITANQFSKDAGTLAKISGGYTLTVSGVKSAIVSNVAANTHVTEIRVIDSNTNIVANLNTLQAASDKVTSIALSGTHPQLIVEEGI